MATTKRRPQKSSPAKRDKSLRLSESLHSQESPVSQANLAQPANLYPLANPGPPLSLQTPPQNRRTRRPFRQKLLRPKPSRSRLPNPPKRRQQSLQNRSR